MFSKLYQYHSSSAEEKMTPPFNELILSWNGLRPLKGKWTFWVSLKEDEWLKVAEWGSDGQRTFKNEGAFAKCYQDTTFPKEGLCHQFQVKVEGEDLSKLHSISVCISNLSAYVPSLKCPINPVIPLRVPQRSQMLLDHPRHRDLCSPTSTTNAINYLMKEGKLDPVEFAEKCHDQGFDIYGNWILNAAEAYTHVKEKFSCHIERLSDFSPLYKQLEEGIPVVVSVKGPIPGAPLPYQFGHLICVIGYEEERVYCIDPGFPTDESTLTSYALKDFLHAWALRKNLAYIFRPIQ